MGHTSWQVKEKYNKKAYDNIGLRVKSGEKEKLKAIAEEKGMSLNAFINYCIEKVIEDENL